jgi:hypothetical protein
LNAGSKQNIENLSGSGISLTTNEEENKESVLDAGKRAGFGV